MNNRFISLYARYYGQRHMSQLHPVDEIDWCKNGFQTSNVSMLYAHIPFCESLCPYCTFHRYQYNEGAAKNYYSALGRELQIYKDQGFQFKALYIGGGTPTINPKLLAEFITSTTKLFPISQISIETNPNYLTPANITFLKDLGIQRLSVGVQSLQDTLLQKMGRLTPYGTSGSILTNLEQAIPEFKTVNVDMIFNLPGQSAEQLLEDLYKLNCLQPTQISWYPLMPAKETIVSMNNSMGHFSFKNESSFYQLIDKKMEDNYQASSAWCFNLKHHEARIDEYVVEHENYLGIGSGAFSYVNGQLLSSTFSIENYIARINNGHTGITDMQILKYREIMRYQLLIRLFGLRVPHTYWVEKYHQLPQQLFYKDLIILKLLGVIEINDVEIRLTQYGRYVWVVLMREFFMGVNNYRTQMRRHVSDNFSDIQPHP